MDKKSIRFVNVNLNENTTTLNSDVEESNESTIVIDNCSLIITSNGRNVRVFQNGMEIQGITEVNFNYKIKEVNEIKITQLVLPIV